MYQVIARKCRPQSFAELIGQEHVRTTLENAITQRRIAHGYIFAGQRGTGKTSALLFVLLIIGSIKANGSTCRALEGAEPQTLIEYLESDRNMQAPDCMTYAIDKLGQQRRAEASRILTMYLDFRKPGTERDPNEPVFDRQPPSPQDLYPAVGALFKTGMPSIPSLVHRIGDRETIDLTRWHALYILLILHRTEPWRAVAALRRASESATDRGTMGRLMDAAKEEAARCHPAGGDLCEDALFQRPTEK
jgi:DNA polymerase III delta prime subunit